MNHWRKFLYLTMFVPVVALSSAAAASYYVTGSNVQDGMLVSLNAQSTAVEPATSKTDANLTGVLSPANADFNQKSGQVNVESDGVASTLVSTLNGPIAAGDRITASSLEGIGAKATASGWIVGIAQDSLTNKTAGVVQSTATDSQGVKHQVYVGRINVLVHVTYYNAAATGTAAKQPESTIQSVADSIAGKHASQLAIVLSFILFLVEVVIVGFTVNGIIRSGFAAISRQPLLRGYFMKMILQAFAVVLVITAGVFVAAFLILRLL